jgi:hypothetical protein
MSANALGAVSKGSLQWHGEQNVPVDGEGS